MCLDAWVKCNLERDVGHRLGLGGIRERKNRPNQHLQFFASFCLSSSNDLFVSDFFSLFFLFFLISRLSISVQWILNTDVTTPVKLKCLRLAKFQVERNYKWNSICMSSSCTDARRTKQKRNNCWKCGRRKGKEKRSVNKLLASIARTEPLNCILGAVFLAQLRYQLSRNSKQHTRVHYARMEMQRNWRFITLFWVFLAKATQNWCLEKEAVN